MVIEQFLLRFVEPKLKLLKWLIGAKEKITSLGVCEKSNWALVRITLTLTPEKTRYPSRVWI